LTKPYDDLATFIASQMRMSHVYQPVMMLGLLKSGGGADVNAIAKCALYREGMEIVTILKEGAGALLLANRNTNWKH
jgi:ATP adenylyltransferase